MFLCAVVFLSAPAAAEAPPSMAILDLTNHTGDPTYDPAGPGVAALLVTRFARTEAVTVVERQRLQDVLNELELNQSGAVDAEHAVRAGRLVGARYVVMGSLFTVQLPTLAVSLRVVDTETGEVVLAEEVVGEIGERGESFFVLIDQLGQAVVSGLDLELSATDRIELSQVDVRELEALLAYGRKLTAPPRDLPAALWRDKTHDMLPNEARRAYRVFNNAGSRFDAEAFARAVGDQETLASIEAAREAARQTGRRRTLGGLATTVVGAAVAGVGAARGEDGDGVLYVGIGLGTIGLCAALSGPFKRNLDAASAAQLGAYWSPEEADRLIEAHNAELE